MKSNSSKDAPRNASRNKGASGAASKKKTAQPGHSSTSPKRLLRAGLNAFSMPAAESAMADGLSKIADSLGFKKLEGVFDQRVAGALDRLGYPSPAELRRLLQAPQRPKRTAGRRKVAR